MDQPVSLSGNFTANPRRYATAGKPHYTAKLEHPETKQVFDAGLFSKDYDYVNKSDGSIEKLKILSGNADLISPRMSIQEQMDAVSAQGNTDMNVTYGRNGSYLRPGQVVLFQKAAEHKKPKDGIVKLNKKGDPTMPSDWYGYWNHNGRLIEIGSWNRQSPEGYLFLGGQTQFPLEREVAPGVGINDLPDQSMSAEELTALEKEIADMDAARGFDQPEQPEQQPDAGIEAFGAQPRRGRGRRSSEDQSR
jgi:hypothetical protein